MIQPAEVAAFERRTVSPVAIRSLFQGFNSFLRILDAAGPCPFI
jgi:hypothetical protein